MLAVRTRPERYWLGVDKWPASAGVAWRLRGYVKELVGGIPKFTYCKQDLHFVDNRGECPTVNVGWAHRERQTLRSCILPIERRL